MILRQALVVLLLTATLATLAVSLPPNIPDNVPDLLEKLDDELGKRDKYINIRRDRAEELRSRILTMADAREAVKLYYQLGEVSSALNADSACVDYTHGFMLARSLGDSVDAQRFRILRAAELTRIAATTQAIADLEHVDSMGIFPDNLETYCRVGHIMHMYMADVFDGSRTKAHEAYLNWALEFGQKHIELLNPESAEHHFCQALNYYADNQRPLFVATLHAMTDTMSFDDPVFPRVVTALGGYYDKIDRDEEAVKFLALGAISDVMNANLHGTALLRLGKALYTRGDLIRAHKYLTLALESAIQANARSNMNMITEILEPVSKDMRTRETMRMSALTFLLFCLLVAISLLWRLNKQKRNKMHELERVKQQLASSNQSKECYILDFMNLCSSYMESLEDLNRVCRTKLSAGRVDDLLDLLKSGRVLDQQRKRFDDIFDDSFLKVYPSFITDVNSLLLPDKQIATPADNILTTELRVLAFARLGIDDTPRVSRFLGVSNNTVYTYRNKLRNKAISRDTFDADIMRIGTIA